MVNVAHVIKTSVEQVHYYTLCFATTQPVLCLCTGHTKTMLWAISTEVANHVGFKEDKILTQSGRSIYKIWGKLKINGKWFTLPF